MLLAGDALNMVSMTLVGTPAEAPVYHFGGGTARVSIVDYAMLKHMNPNTAWLFYYPVTVLFAFFLLNGMCQPATMLIMLICSF